MSKARAQAAVIPPTSAEIEVALRAKTQCIFSGTICRDQRPVRLESCCPGCLNILAAQAIWQQEHELDVLKRRIQRVMLILQAPKGVDA